jgi:hypothetical protein
VKKLHGTPPDATLTFDLAEFLTGEAAAQAAAEHGDESPPPNDYYIVNDNPKLRTMPIAPDATIQAIDWTNCCELTDALHGLGGPLLNHGRVAGNPGLLLDHRDGRRHRVDRGAVPALSRS